MAQVQAHKFARYKSIPRVQVEQFIAALTPLGIPEHMQILLKLICADVVVAFLANYDLK